MKIYDYTSQETQITTESNVSEAIQQPSSVKYEQKSDAGRDIKHNLEETTECRQWNVRDGMHKQKCGMTMNRLLVVTMSSDTGML